MCASLCVRWIRTLRPRETCAFSDSPARLFACLTVCLPVCLSACLPACWPASLVVCKQTSERASRQAARFLASKPKESEAGVRVPFEEKNGCRKNLPFPCCLSFTHTIPRLQCVNPSLPHPAGLFFSTAFSRDKSMFSFQYAELADKSTQAVLRTYSLTRSLFQRF